MEQGGGERRSLPSRDRGRRHIHTARTRARTRAPAPSSHPLCHPTLQTTTPAARPLPLPAPVALGLRAVFGARRLASVFYESEASDHEELDARRGGYRRQPAAPGAAATPAAPIPRPDSAGELDGARAGEAADRARVHTIRRAILEAGDDLRAAHPWLEPAQDVIGGALIVACVGANLACAAAFAAGALGPLACILACAFAQSILHEVEHDLIHSLYFKKGGGRAAHNAALAAVYACRLSTLNPWARRRLHLHHHAASGTASDLEERAITNGLAWSPLRLLVTGDNLLAIVLRPAASLRELRDYIRAVPAADPAAHPATFLATRASILAANAGGYFPGGALHYGLWYTFLANAAVGLARGGGFLAPGGALAGLVTVYAAAFGAPNFLRTFCLHLVSSNIHYAGIRKGDVLNQTQVLTHPAFWPAQAFCANFGGTHAIHHFVVRDPFYIRQAIAPRVLPVLKAQGVRFNDVGTFWRANRVPADQAEAAAAKAA